ncbi:MAG: metalloregulator ArsR/SmtB family transcription factor [Clostridia bacterium]
MKLEEIVNEYIPDNETLENISSFFSLFSDNTRLKIISLLSISTLCVSDIAFLLRINQTTISHQLGILRNAKIISATKSGKKIIYSINNNYVQQIIELGLVALS